MLTDVLQTEARKPNKPLISHYRFWPPNTRSCVLPSQRTRD